MDIKMNKIFYLDINNVCNNNCVGCAINPNVNVMDNKSLDIIKTELIEGKKQGYNILHPIGGEPTLHPDFIKILKKAKTLYSEIAITTNGRMFSYKEYASKFKSLKLNFNITICGPNEKIHDSWTGVPGSFQQTIKGIQNLTKDNHNICLNIICWNQAVININKYIPLIKKFKPKELGILALGPFGRCKTRFNNLNPDLFQLKKLNDFLFRVKGLVEDIDIEDFPLCIFNRDLINNSKLHFQDISSSVYIDVDGKIETLGLFAAHDLNYPINSLNLNNANISKMKKQINSYKIKLIPCINCIMNDRCKGIYNSYVLLKGKKNVEEQLIELKTFNEFC
jgi:MoaA/NifB/PqqE/SkfB family radical SAM enzyme